MKACDFMTLSRPVDVDLHSIYSNNPTVTPDGVVAEPYRYMIYSDLQQADPETVRGYVDYIRRVYGVSNSVLAATCGTNRCNVIRILQRAGVPALTQVEGCEIRSRYDRTAWAEFVSGKRRNSEKMSPESNTILISGLTDGQIMGLLVLLEPHKNVKVKFCERGGQTTMTEIYIRRGTNELSRAVKMITIDALTNHSANRRALANLRNDKIPSATQQLTPTAGVQVSHAENRTTDNVAMSIVTTPYYDRLTKTIAAVEKLISSLSPTDRRLIYYVYICATPITVEAAADLLGIGKTAAYARINVILTQLARDLGFIPPAT